MVNDFSSDLFNQLFKIAQSSLSNFVSEITVKQSEIIQASKSYQYIKQVLQSKSDEGTIPKLNSYEEPFLTGSYIRKTKISPLNDIDIFLVLDGSGTVLSGADLTFSNSDCFLSDYSTDGWSISSIAVLNTIKKTLGETYSSDIVRDQQAVSVELTSYQMTIDIVPCVAIKDAPEYIIPIGKGESGWKKSNPKKDEDIVTSLDDNHNKVVKPAIKIAKFWNREKNFNVLSNYHIEAISYFIFSSLNFTMTTIQEACRLYFNNMIPYVTNCPDPTGLSEPVSNYLKLDLLETLNLNSRITEARKAASGVASDFITYLRG